MPSEMNRRARPMFNLFYLPSLKEPPRLVTELISVIRGERAPYRSSRIHLLE